MFHFDPLSAQIVQTNLAAQHVCRPRNHNKSPPPKLEWKHNTTVLCRPERDGSTSIPLPRGDRSKRRCGPPFGTQRVPPPCIVRSVVSRKHNTAALCRPEPDSPCRCCPSRRRQLRATPPPSFWNSTGRTSLHCQDLCSKGIQHNCAL
jgi:hypothetical protein